MTATLLAAVLASVVSAQEPSGAHILGLSCVEALASVGESRLAGVFSFIAEKDSPAAFADFLVHDKAALKKFVAKIDKDVKATQGVSQWDHEALATALQILSSPLGETVDKPAPKLIERMVELSRTQTMTLEQMTAARRKK